MFRLIRFIFRIVISAFTLWASVENAWSSPQWIDELPAEDKRFKYYVGRSTAVRDEAQAFRDAMKDAIEQAVRANFGVMALLSADSVQTEDSSRGVVRISERTREVKMEGFEQSQYHVKRGDDGIRVWVLCRYAQASIRREKERLAREEAQPDGARGLAFSRAGASSSALQTDLEVVSDPPGARVIVDGEIQGKTPLRIQGQLPAGPVSLILDHPTHDPIVSRVVLIPGKTLRINETLVRGRGTLEISSEPSGASVSINGIEYGRTPLSGIRLEAGAPAEILFTHPNAETIAHRIQLERSSRREILVRLPLKPGRLVYRVEPRDAVVTLEGRRVASVDSSQLPPGTYRLTASRDGFVQEERKVDILAGETTDLGNLSLVSISEEEKRLARSPWIFELGSGYLGSPGAGIPRGGLIFSLGLQKRFMSRFTLGARFGASQYMSGESHGYSYEREFTSTELSLSGRVRLLGEFHADFESGRIRGHYQTHGEDSVSQHLSLRTHYRGLGTSWEGDSTLVGVSVRDYAETRERALVFRVAWIGKW